MEPFPFPSMVLPGTQARRKGVKKLPPYYCYVSTLNGKDTEKAYTYRAFRITIPKRLLKKAKKEGSPKAWVTFRYGSRNALSRTEADTGAIAPGGLVRVARCLIPESKKIAALLNEQFTKFGNKSWVSQSKSKQLQDNKGDAPPTAPNMVVECADWYSNCLDDGSGMCDDPDNWHTECAYYTWVNQGGGSDDGGGPGDGNSGPTGGGSTSGGNGGTGNGDDADPCLHGVYGCEPCEMPNPPAYCNDPTPNEDPCEQAENLENDSAFKTKMQNLKSDAVSKNYETGYLMTKNANGSYNYSHIQGVAGGASININTLLVINGYIHSHYQGLFSTFSGSDLRAIYQLYANGNIASLDTFTAGVVTAAGTTYLMKIANKQAFLNFAQSNLDSNSDFANFEFDYTTSRNAFIGVFGNEKGEIVSLLDLLESKNAGIKIFKGGSNFTNWQAIKTNSGNTDIINTNCN